MVEPDWGIIVDLKGLSRNVPDYRATAPMTAATIPMTPAMFNAGMAAAFPVSVLVAAAVEFLALELGEVVLVMEAECEEDGAAVIIVLPE